MPGYRHSALNDISRIRQDLRDRYQDGFAILKELLQNTDDAGAGQPGGEASQLVILLSDNGLSNSRHPLLLNAPGLAVLNNGAFTLSDAVSITSLGMSNKAGQGSTAGKFGLGLKSIFHWAEAFFYFSSSTFDQNERMNVSASDLLNPWGSGEADRRRHMDWEEAWETSKAFDIVAFQQLAERCLDNGQWFGLWIPLRQPDHLLDPQGEIKPIEQRFPKPDFDDLFGQDWKSRLAATLPLLRRLRSVRLCKWEGNNLTEYSKFEVGNDTQRMHFGLNGTLNANTTQELTGEVNENCKFTGCEYVNHCEELNTLKSTPHWPNQPAIGPDGGDQQVPEKAEPHGAVIFVRQLHNEAHGYLMVHHAVFLPLGEPEVIKGEMQERYHLYLHGFFFVDSGRRYIQPFDDLPENMTPEQIQSESQVIKLWNRTLLRKVVAPLVLPSLNAFVQKEKLDNEKIELLVKAMLKAEKLKPLLPHICIRQRYVFRLQPNGGHWKHEKWDLANGQPPRWIALPKPMFTETMLFKLLPALNDLCIQTTVSFQDKPALADGEPDRINDNELAELLESVPAEYCEEAESFRYLLVLVPKETAQLTCECELSKALIQLAKTIFALNLFERDELIPLWKELFKRLPTKALVTLPLKSVDAREEIKNVLANHSLPVALLWQDWHETQGEGVIPSGNLVPLLNALGNLELMEKDAVRQRSILVIRLIRACNDVRQTWPATLNQLPLFAARQVDGNVIPISFALLLAAFEKGLTFTGGEEWLKPLTQAAPQIKPLVIEQHLAEALGLNVQPCNVSICIHLLLKAQSLATPFSERKALFEKLLGQTDYSELHSKALRCLLHGRRDQWENYLTLLVEPHHNDAFVELAKLALASVQQSWRFIAHQTLAQIALNDRHRQCLRLTSVSVETIENLIQEIGAENVDCVALDIGQCDSILNNFNNPDLLKKLNIHTTLDGRRVRIGPHTYTDNGSFKELPEAFNRLVTRLSPRPAYGRFINVDGSNRLVNPLNWEAVIEIAISQPHPADWWDTLLTAIGHLGTLRNELRAKVSAIEWLPLAAGGAVRPADLLHISGAESHLDRLPEEILRDKIPLLRLAPEVREHERFETFLKTVLPRPEESLQLLVELLKQHSQWGTGLTGEWTLEQCQEWVAALGDAPSEVLPGAALIKALFESRPVHEHLPEFLKNLCGQFEVATYAKVLIHLMCKHKAGDERERPTCNKIFVRYLQMIDAVGFEFATTVLQSQDLMLLSAGNEWKPPTRLTWPTHGIVPNDQLNKNFSEALSTLRVRANQIPINIAPENLHESFEEAYQETAQRLRSYFTSWRDYVPAETIGAFIAILGDGINEQVKALAVEHLGQNTVEGVREAIAGIAPVNLEVPLQNALGYYQFACAIHQANQVEVLSVLGTPLTAQVGGEHTTIFLGEGFQAFPAGGDLLRPQRWIHLLPIQPNTLCQDTETLISILRASAEQLLTAVFSQNGINLQPLWQKWSQPSQLHIRIAQKRVVEMAQAFLRQIGAHHWPEIRDVLKKWDRADRRRAEAEENERPIPAEILKELTTAKDDIRKKLSSEMAIQQKTLAAVRRKIEQYQYDSSSVPFELWQNADDAVVELQVLGIATAELEAMGCVLISDQQSVSLMHWGRLINEFQGSGGCDHRERGFDQDLEKMLVQSISDKGAEGSVMVTGKFGLGFKSVFLVSDTPEVVSGNLDFAICGGIYPVRLAPERREALVAELKRWAPAQWRRGTIIHLSLRGVHDNPAVAVTSLFYRLAPLLVIFSRKIRRLRLLCQQGGELQEINWRAEVITNGIESGDLRLIADHDEKIQRALVFSGQSAEDRWHLLLGLGSDGFVALPKDVPTYWVTAPTRATPDYGFAVNAPFEPDVGRIQLALNSERNQHLADEIARTLAIRLNELFKLAQQNWVNLRHRLALATQTTPLLFWQSLWHVVAERFSERVTPSRSSMDSELARRILWPSNNTGLRGFYHECEALPAGLWGQYNILTRIPNITFQAAGALDKEEIFTTVQNWPSFFQRIKPGRIASSRRVVSILQKLACLQDAPEEIYLASVVEWELKCDEEYRADSEVAARLGQLLKPHFLNRLKEGDLRVREEREAKALGDLLPEVKFQAADGSWHKPAELLVADAPIPEVHRDEIMRAAFAPQHVRLHSGYAGSAQQFFLACRPTLQADASVLAQWIIQAMDDTSRISAVRYLLEGQLSEKVAGQIRGQHDPDNWLWQAVEQPENFPWFNHHFSPEELHELRAYILRTRDEEVRQIYGTQQELLLPVNLPLQPTVIWTVSQLWTWWDRQGCPTDNYVLEGQPNWELFGAWNPDWRGLPEPYRASALREAFLATNTDTGKALWYRLFGFACLISAGRTMTELRRFWTTRLDAQHFWEITHAGDFSEATRDIFERAVYIEFQDHDASGEQAYFWRRVFYDLRKVHLMIRNDFPSVILELISQMHGGNLFDFLRAGRLPGPELQPWVGVFGQSADTPLRFIVRELYRLGVINDEAVLPFAFYTCRPVKRALVKIGWITYEDQLFDGTAWIEKLSQEPEAGEQLKAYYDIPFLHMGLECRHGALNPPAI